MIDLIFIFFLFIIYFFHSKYYHVADACDEQATVHLICQSNLLETYYRRPEQKPYSLSIIRSYAQRYCHREYLEWTITYCRRTHLYNWQITFK